MTKLLFIEYRKGNATMVAKYDELDRPVPRPGEYATIGGERYHVYRVIHNFDHGTITAHIRLD